jgi:hypothetical protein
MRNPLITVSVVALLACATAGLAKAQDAQLHPSTSTKPETGPSPKSAGAPTTRSEKRDESGARAGSSGAARTPELVEKKAQAVDTTKPGADRTVRPEKRDEGAARAESSAGPHTSETPERKTQQTVETPKPAADHADKTRPESAEAERTGASQAKPAGAGAGNAAATGRLNIPQEKASQIVETLTRTTTSSNVNVAMNIGVAINVGVIIPANVTLEPLAPEVVTLVPEFRGYDYVVVQDEVIIVEPSSRQVVEIIRRTNDLASRAGPATEITLTDAQQQLLIESIRGENLAPAQVADLANGATVNAGVELAPMPQAVVAQVPTIERYRVFVTNNGGVALVDPDTRTVVDVIE